MNNFGGRFCAALLSIIILTTAFAACSNKSAESPKGSDTVNSAGTATAGTETSILDIYRDDLPEADFEQREVRVMSVTYNPASYLTLFDPETQSGDVVEDALYSRNRILEERFNFVFTTEENTYENCYTALKKQVKAAEDNFALIMLINRNAYAAALDGSLMKISDLPYINTEKPYYSQDVNSQLSVGGKMFFAYSEECFNMFEQMIVVAFNKSMAGSYNLSSFYDTVKNGKWTFETFFEYARATTADINGDGEFTNADHYGIISEEDFLYPSFWVSSGSLTINKDSDDLPYFAAHGNERFEAVVSKAVGMLAAQKVFYNIGGNRTDNNNFFAEGGGLMRVTTVGRLNALREMEQDYGVVPFPKYDEAQEKIYTRVIDGWLHCVPVTCGDPDMISIIMEALASETAITVFPSYYDKAISYKVLRDEESIEMLELCRSNRTIDIGDVPWVDTVRSIYSPLFNRGDTDVASASEKNLKKVVKAIEQAIEAADSL